MTIQNSINNRILVIGINCIPELTGIGKYTGEMVAWFAENGYDCNVITSYPYYPYWKIQKPYRCKFYHKETLKDGMLTLYRCPLYVPTIPTGFKRLIHEGSFFISGFFMILRMLFKPSHKYIYCISPPFHLGFLAIFYRFFKGGEIIYHVQDMQIEAARDLKILRPASVFKFLFWLERCILKRVDYVTTISDGMLKKNEQKTSTEVSLFPNWVDINKFKPIHSLNINKADWGFNDSDKLVLYSGSIGEKQGLDKLIAIAVRLKEYEDIKIIICGTGPYKNNLQQLSISSGATNITFLPLQEHNVFNNFLNIISVHLVIQKAGASDLVMPSKLTTILAAGGLALVTAEKETSLYKVINKYNMGIVIPPEDDAILYDAILDCCNTNYAQLRLNARNYAEKYLEKEAILRDISTRWRRSDSN